MATASTDTQTAAPAEAVKRRFWPRSLRWRLQLWLAVLLVSMLAAMMISAYELARTNRMRQIDTDVEARLTALSLNVREFYRDAAPPSGRGGGPLGPPGPRPFDRPPSDRPLPPSPDQASPFRPPPWAGGPQPPFGPRPTTDFRVSAETGALFGAEAGYYFTVWAREGAVVDRSANVPADVPPPAAGDRDTLPHFRTRGTWREAIHCSGLGDCALAGQSLDADLAALSTLRWSLLGAGGLVLALGLGVCWAITTIAIRPIDEISAAAERISTGDLSGRVPVADTDTELGGLAAVLNTTFSRLDAAFARQLQFTADAAHELRTPLAVIISETQTALARDRSAGEYRETVAGCLETAQQMRQLTESLLALARVDGSDAVPHREHVDVGALVEMAATRFRETAQHRGVAIHSKLPPTSAFTTPERLEQVINNLLSNALDYNRPGGTVTLSTRNDGGDAVFTIADTGVGISGEHLPHIFDRFYRVDKSRSRVDGHAGLGLAICKTIVDAEHGRITVQSAEGVGTTFEVRLPREPQEAHPATS